MKVLFSPDVHRYFCELGDTLYEKEYFGFEDSVIQYVRTLIFAIEKNLYISTKREAPPYFEQFVKKSSRFDLQSISANKKRDCCG